MGRKTFWPGGLLLLALLGCSDGGEPPSAAGTENAGGTAASEPVASSAAPACVPAECAEGEGACEGDDRLTCQQGKWVRNPCDEAGCKAAGKGPLQGCLLDDQDRPTCVCGCTSAEDSCVDATVAQFCGEDGTSYRLECTDEICKAAGYKGLVAGSGCKTSSSGAYCDCIPNCTVGITCSEQGGKASVTVCDGQSQKTYSCDDVCGEDGQVASPKCAGVNDNGDKVCFCGTGKCSVEGQQKCAGNSKVQFCQNGVWLESACSDKACKDAGFSGWSGTCGVGSSGKESCLCN